MISLALVLSLCGGNPADEAAPIFAATGRYADVATPSTQPLDAAKPVVILWVMESCPPCVTAKTALAAAKDLPFTFEVRTKYPAYVTLLPSFDWGPENGKPEIVGWPGLPALLKAFEAKPAGLGVPVPLAAVSWQHSHTCRTCNVRWFHGAEAAGNPAAHNCPRCGRVQREID